MAAAGRAGLGQCLQQQVSDRRQGRADHESAKRLGGRQARCAEGRRATLDSRHAVGSEGTLCTVPAVLLWHLELRQEQVGGQEPARLPLAEVGGREDGGGECRLRPARVREVHDVQGLGRGGTAEGHALPLSQSAQSSDPVGGRSTGTAEDRRANLYPGDPDQDGGALHAGRSAGKDARLGRERGRRLHAHLSLRLTCCARVNGRRQVSCVAVRSGMVDATLETPSLAGSARRRSAFRKVWQRKSTIAFLMTLPLIVLVALLVIYPAFYSIHLAT